MEALFISKERIKQVLSDFPEEVTVSDFIDRIVIIAKVEKAIEQVDKGEYLTSGELDEEIKKWE